MSTIYHRLRPNTARTTKTAIFTATTTTKSPSWNTLLRESAKNSNFTKALSLYIQMLRSNSSPNAFTFPFALKSCASLSLPITGTQLHCHVIKMGCLLEPFVQTSLISMYCKCGLIQNARAVFDENPQSRKLTVCYNALISGYASNGKIEEMVLLFKEMMGLGVEINGVTVLGLVPGCGSPENLGLGMCFHGCCLKFGLNSESAVGNCLLTMYADTGEVNEARKLFDEMPRRELISWNSMINGYAQNGLANEVLELYKEMDSYGIIPDAVTLVGVLSSCANLGAQGVGRSVERKIDLNGFRSNPFLSNALINMYARCGNLVKAREVFDSMDVRSVVSWTAIIGGYGMHGQGEVAVQLFDDMIRSGIRPDGTAFVSILSACSHSGFTNKGLDYFYLMQREYKLQPGPEHYSCVVDLLGRAGRLEEALKHIETMKVRPDGAVWGALLGACKIHKNVELAELAFEKVIQLEPTNIGYYVLLANIYAEARNSLGIIRVRTLMRQRKLRKDPGCSYVEFKGRVQLFFAGDATHPQIEEIHKKLNELERSVSLDESKNNVHERRDEVINNSGVHSEKLAITFGILNIKQEEDIVVIKNLRICGDCHFFMKSVSKIVDRRFVIRDATRFHHFENGVCSCKDYW